MYRVWSTNWIKEPESEGKKLLKAIENAIQNYNESIKHESKKAASMSYLDISDRPQTHNNDLPRSKYFGATANEIPLSDFENIMLKILSQSFGIDKDSLFKTTALCYGWQRRGDIIKDRLEISYKQLIKKGKIREIDNKVTSA